MRSYVNLHITKYIGFLNCKIEILIVLVRHEVLESLGFY